MIVRLIGVLALELRYGLEGGRPHSLDEIGKAYGLTRERVRQIAAAALGKLRAVAGTARQITAHQIAA